MHIIYSAMCEVNEELQSVMDNKMTELVTLQRACMEQRNRHPLRSSPESGAEGN